MDFLLKRTCIKKHPGLRPKIIGIKGDSFPWPSVNCTFLKDRQSYFKRQLCGMHPFILGF